MDMSIDFNFGTPGLGGAANPSAGTGAAGGIDAQSAMSNGGLQSSQMQQVLELVMQLLKALTQQGGGTQCNRAADQAASQLPQPNGTGGSGVAAGTTPAGERACSALKQDMGSVTALQKQIAANPGTASPQQLKQLGQLNDTIGGELQNLPVGELRAHRGEIKPAMEDFQNSAQAMSTAVQHASGADSEPAALASVANASASAGVNQTCMQWAAAIKRDGVVPKG